VHKVRELGLERTLDVLKLLKAKMKGHDPIEIETTGGS
jgi:hypothetical protein